MADTLKGQVVLIVGASSGIGRATTLMAARAGATVVAAARRKERLEAMQAELAGEGLRIVVYQADATSLDDLTSLVSAVLLEHGQIDIAVYATGTNAPERSMKVMPPETWTNILDTNLNGAFYLAHAVLPTMRQAGAGHIIFVSSTAGAIADLSGAAYQASKRGLLGLAHAIRLEERAAGIRTCCVMPGLTNTELVEKRPEKLSGEMLEKALQPDDVAATILHVMAMPPRVTVPEILMVPSLA
ncbi:SDR family oxidoreductase [Edaphobacter modestus]|uniref:NADP-dependent 3-hydroxy acid dehydrogenase YdfG n=1 Tax=Edaphobacter modestus TaxID=388466 RepID=A0A4Q7XYV4_9BACT|nr:SDR family oxidoreductase [Edaphobacter modestus]RZU29597.1 NADP-dependent 3-hydroxy acid dehydrogenase YdfG [Edaphobacter modestus]